MSEVLEELKNKFGDSVINEEVSVFVKNVKCCNFKELMIEITKRIYAFDANSNKTDIDLSKQLLSYIQSIYAGNISSSIDTTINYDELIEEGLKIIIACEAAKSLEQAKDSQNEYASMLYEVSFGRAYPVFIPFIFYNLLKYQESLIKKVYGITFDEFFKGIDGLYEAFFDIVQKIKSNQNIGMELFSVKQATNWPDKLIDDLTYKNGEASYFSSREKYANWFNIEMPSKAKPFISVDGCSYFFGFSIVFDCLYRAIQKSICANDPHNIDEWTKKQQIASENFSIGLLNTVLKGSVSYQNNYYKIGKDWFENDGIIIYNNILFVVEIKAGSYTPKSIFTDSTSHTIAQKNLLEKPLSQCERLIEELNKNDVLQICDKEHSKIVVLNKNDYKEIIPIAVTLEPIGEILAMYRASSINLNFLPISLPDLVIYSNFFEDEPILFIHYLLQRVKDITIENFFINDELDYLGAYLSNRDFNYRYNHITEQENLGTEKIGSVFIDNMHQDIDEYYDSYMHKSKPKFHLNSFIKDLLNAIKENIDIASLDLAIEILNLSDGFHNNIQYSLNTIKKRQATQRRFSTVTIFPTGNDTFIPIQLFENDTLHYYVDEGKATKYALAQMLTLNRKDIFYMIVYFNRQKISNVKIKYLTRKNLADFPIDEIYFLVDYIDNTSIKK